jgi:hypothetical protein
MSEPKSQKRSLIQGPPKLQGPRTPLPNPQPDPQRPPTMGEMIREGLANFIGFGGEIDPVMGPPSTTPRAKGLEAPAAFGAIAGMVNPASVAKILKLLKIPNPRMVKTIKAFEEFKQDHPGTALFSNVNDQTGDPRFPAGTIASAGPIPVMNRAGLIPQTVQAPEAPIFDTAFPRRPRNTIEALDQELMGVPPFEIKPGRLELGVSEALEDYDVPRIYGMLGHEANHAAQFAKNPQGMLPQYMIDRATSGYFRIPAESRARFAGYKKEADYFRSPEQKFTPEMLQALRRLQNDERFFAATGTPISRPSRIDTRAIIKSILEPEPPTQSKLFMQVPKK